MVRRTFPLKLAFICKKVKGNPFAVLTEKLLHRRKDDLIVVRFLRIRDRKSLGRHRIIKFQIRNIIRGKISLQILDPVGTIMFFHFLHEFVHHVQSDIGIISVSQFLKVSINISKTASGVAQSKYRLRFRRLEKFEVFQKFIIPNHSTITGHVQTHLRISLFSKFWRYRSIRSANFLFIPSKVLLLAYITIKLT